MTERAPQRIEVSVEECEAILRAAKAGMLILALPLSRCIRRLLGALQ